MADSDKIITVTPNTSVATTHPEIKFVGKDNSPMYLKVLDDNTLSFEGTEGQVFAISPTMSSGDIFSVNDISGVQSIAVNADGTITMDAQAKSTTIKNNASDTSTLILENTNDDEIDGPILEFYRNTASPADNGDMGTLLFTGTDDAGNKQEYGRITMEFDDVSNTGEEGELIFRLTEAGASEQEYMRLRGSSRQIEFNTTADDIDMTWNSDTVSDMMYWNAGSGTNGITIGGGTTTPDAPLHIAGTADNSGGYKAHLRIDDYGTAFDAANSGGAITFGGLQDATNIAYWAKISGEKANTTEDDRSGTLHFWTRKEGGNPLQRMMVDEDGHVAIGNTNPSFASGSGLHITNSTQANVRLEDDAGEYFDMVMQQGDAYLMNRANGKLEFWTNGTERMEIQAGGTTIVRSSFQGYKTVIKSVSSNTTLADADSGKTVYWTGGTLTLPATAALGQQYVIINNTGSSATPALGTSNAIASGWTAHAAMADETARTYISPATNKWIYIG